jgi:hypothetical protein
MFSIDSSGGMMRNEGDGNGGAEWWRSTVCRTVEKNASGINLHFFASRGWGKKVGRLKRGFESRKSKRFRIKNTSDRNAKNPAVQVVFPAPPNHRLSIISSLSSGAQPHARRICGPLREGPG